MTVENVDSGVSRHEGRLALFTRNPRPSEYLRACHPAQWSIEMVTESRTVI